MARRVGTPTRGPVIRFRRGPCVARPPVQFLYLCFLYSCWLSITLHSCLFCFLSQDAVRLAAVQWACRLFPFEHVPARWVCVLAAGDARHDVREEALKGLRPPKGLGGGGGGAAAAAVAAAADAAGAAGAAGSGVGRLPSLYCLLKYVRARLPR